MILLNLVAELRGAPGSATFHDRADYDAIERRCVAAIRRHHRPERGLVFETIGADGALLDSPEGRLINPGHVIECGWFMLDFARRTQDAKLREEALAMIRGALDFGWDREFGGILYFLDSEGFSPQQLEWPMKLWWPHCEAIVALLMAWRDSGDAVWFARFEEVTQWTFAHFPDTEHGEWYGYLDRRGAVSQRFKGGPYKGCFHVPRALWLCERELTAALAAR
jgi:N-acylglucosamine 2-epimerase